MFIFAQCPSLNFVLLRNQAEVDEFVSEYPDCTEIESFLAIGVFAGSDESSDITDLSGLSSLTRIGSSLEINKTDSLITLEGLENITYIGNDLKILNNVNLRDISALTNVDSIGRHLLIERNDSLEVIPDFNALNHLGSLLVISRNENLKSIGTFNLLTNIGSSVKISDSPLLNALGGFNNLTSIEGGLTISDTGIRNFSAFNNLIEIREDDGFGGLFILRNPSLENLSGLEKLQTISPSLLIDNCESLTTISALSSLTTIHENFRMFNTSIENVESLGNVIIGNGFVRIRENGNLTSLGDLRLASTINGDLDIHDNTFLEILPNFENVDSVLGRFEVSDNVSLSNCLPICNLLLDGYIEGFTSIFGNLSGCETIEEITQNSCNTSSTIEISTSNPIKISPNPIRNKLNIEVENGLTDEVEILIIDHNGKTVYSNIRKLVNKVHNLEISEIHLSSGVYTILLNRGTIAISRFIKI